MEVDDVLRHPLARRDPLITVAPDPGGRDLKDPGTCQEPGCHLPAVRCAVHGRSKQPIPPTRTVIKDLIRELEWEGPERWARVIESLRRML